MLKALLSIFLLSHVTGEIILPIVYNHLCNNKNHSEPSIIPQNNCVSFSITQGTGCARC